MSYPKPHPWSVLAEHLKNKTRFDYVPIYIHLDWENVLSWSCMVKKASKMSIVLATIESNQMEV